MHPLRLIAALIATAAVPVQAQTTTNPVTTVFGQPDCGEWVRNTRQPDRAWLLGYLSGMNKIHNATGGKSNDPLNALNSADQAYLWMDNWCKENPLKKVGAGAMDLFIELMTTKR